MSRALCVMVSSADPFFADTITATHPSKKRVPANTFMLRLSLASSSRMQCLWEGCKQEHCWPRYCGYSRVGGGIESGFSRGLTLEAGLLQPCPPNFGGMLLTSRAYDAIIC